ncbi:hypothetical protein F2P44_06435 [Massilia sp. CCM 8695]|uniref:DUF2486 family protein n=1 Tax=Massilia frigida TaxID=2609281 RepID=A0ABX0N0W6_9BURK|nr:MULTISPECIES: hypothetical protein [Massilia]MDM5181227.1 hypothetical protein [Massilia sp. DJPM01]NHZ78917.1 hypothetical protein [Massilia frigida]
MTQARPFDPNIPVLTELFSDQGEAQADPGAQAAAQEPLLADWSDPEWAALERRLSGRILQQIQGRVDFVLEQRLRDSLEQVLQHAVAGLAAELRIGLQDTIESIVVRAVAQELSHLQSQQ